MLISKHAAFGLLTGMAIRDPEREIFRKYRSSLTGTGYEHPPDLPSIDVLSPHAAAMKGIYHKEFGTPKSSEQIVDFYNKILAADLDTNAHDIVINTPAPDEVRRVALSIFDGQPDRPSDEEINKIIADVSQIARYRELGSVYDFLAPLNLTIFGRYTRAFQDYLEQPSPRLKQALSQLLGRDLPEGDKLANQIRGMAERARFYNPETQRLFQKMLRERPGDAQRAMELAWAMSAAREASLRTMRKLLHEALESSGLESIGEGSIFNAFRTEPAGLIRKKSPLPHPDENSE